MRRILVAACEQEISSFNPVPTEYRDFEIFERYAVLEQAQGSDTTMRGALDRFAGHTGIEIVPTIAAKCRSGGPLSAEGFDRLGNTILEAIRTRIDGIDAIYFSMHGAMGSVAELDPEGFLLEAVRHMAGPHVPIVISLDLHGILTARMLQNCNGIAVYHTYPHQDFMDTGERAAGLLLRILEDGMRPVMARVKIPALVRGPELITATGLYGGLIRRCKQLESEGTLAAAMMIGNPFTDVPELCCQSLVITDGDAELARREALRLAQDFWPERGRMQASLTPLEQAIAEARTLSGPVTFTDAADAPSSGASGDSNLILRGLLEAGYPGKTLMPIVDPTTVALAHEAGIGAVRSLPIGGCFDPLRFPPLTVEAQIAMLGDGEYRHQVSRLPAHAGKSAVLKVGNCTIIAVSEPVHMMDRAIFLAHGCDPKEFDLIVVKSPGAYARYFTFAERNYVLDIQGSTTANLPLLGHTICARPIYPLETDTEFDAEVEVYRGHG